MIQKKMVVRAAAMCAAVLLAGAMTGCGKTEIENKESEQEQSTQQSAGQDAQVTEPLERIVLRDLEVEQYVTLGDYKSIRTSRQPVEVNEADLQELFDAVYIDSFPEELGIKDRAVEIGDTANIDYVGKKDGEAFGGGTAQGHNLTIGSHAFIDGFEDGLVGVMPGETVDLNLKFPEKYDNADLAGQEVVFTVTVNYIIPAEKMEEAVKNFGVEEVTSLEELRQYVYDYLYSLAESENQSLYEEEVLDAFMNVCEFKEIPESMLTTYREITRQNIASVAASAGTDPETYIYYYYNTDLETFLDLYSDNALRQNIAMQAVANREGLTVEDEELNETLQQYTAEAGYESVEEYIGDSSLEEFREYFMYENVYQYLMEIAGQED